MAQKLLTFGRGFPTSLHTKAASVPSFIGQSTGFCTKSGANSGPLPSICIAPPLPGDPKADAADGSGDTVESFPLVRLGFWCRAVFSSHSRKCSVDKLNKFAKIIYYYNSNFCCCPRKKKSIKPNPRLGRVAFNKRLAECRVACGTGMPCL